MTTRIATIFFALLVVVTGVLVPLQHADAADLGCSKRDRSGQSSAIRGDKSLRPVVLVHGWTANRDAMRPVEKAIKQKYPNRFSFQYFDYRNANTEWAAHNRVASCLADYIHAVSDAYKQAGGDGRVHVVAHSMGGLATRFATDPAYTDQPVGASILAGVTTIATPYLGSPWGNTVPGAIKQWWDELFNHSLMPDRRSDAVHCLALHDRNRRLPSDCATAPYLPNGVRVDQISGDNVVRRTVFGISLYDIDLRSDGVVGVDSATGYLLGSGPPGAASPRGSISDAEIGCTITSDQTIKLLRSFGKSLPAGIIDAEIKAIGQLNHDSGVLDAINGGQLSVDLGVMLLVAARFYGCSHNALLENDESLDAVAKAVDKQAKSWAETAMIKVVGVDDSGNPLADWKSRNIAESVLDCTYVRSASSSVGKDIVGGCGSNADSAHTCWVQQDRRSLICAIDPWEKIYLRYRTASRLTTSFPPVEDPEPEWIELDDGTKCTLRHGGAWGARADNLIGAYGCDGSEGVVLTGDEKPTIDTSTKRWTVRVGELGDPSESFPPPTVRVIAKAYFPASP